MPGPLKNPKHEAFAQALAKGNSQADAYATAGYTPSEPHASRLASNGKVAARVAELQGRAAAKVVVTIETLMGELEEARALAIKENQSSAAVSATMGKAKLAGLIVDRKVHTGPNGGPIQTVDLTKLSGDELAQLESIFGPLAGSGDDDAPDQGGEGEESI